MTENARTLVASAARSEGRPSLQKVILIHGINTEGQWQKLVQEVLEPHFECVIFKYSEFREFGALKAPLAKRLRSTVAKKYLSAYEAAYQPGQRPPHVIAHSFGTVLTGEILKRAQVRFSRIVLTGTALPRRFPWSRLLDANPLKFQDVRNETGAKDWVVRVARFGGLFSRKLGDAGRKGFVGTGVHGIAGPLEACVECADDRRRVHNVPLGEVYGHSDHFLSRRHAAELWLPYLWGACPARYLELLESCRACLRHEERDELAQVDEYLAKIGEWRMSSELSGMADEMSINEYIDRQLQAGRRHGRITRGEDELRDAIPMIVDSFVRLIVTAAIEQEASSADRRPATIQALHPANAVRRSLRTFLTKYQGSL